MIELLYIALGAIVSFPLLLDIVGIAVFCLIIALFLPRPGRY